MTLGGKGRGERDEATGDPRTVSGVQNRVAEGGESGLRILILNDAASSQALVDLLPEEGYVVTAAATWPEAREILDSTRLDLVLVELGFMGQAGAEDAEVAADAEVSAVLREISHRFPRVVTLALMDSDDAQLQVQALDAGAMAIQTTPITQGAVFAASLRALVRVRSIALRQRAEAESLCVNGVEIHLHTGKVVVNRKSPDLKRSERTALKVLMVNAGRVVTDAELGTHGFASPKAGRKAADNAKAKLAKKGWDRIEVVRGVGLLFPRGPNE